MKLSMMDFEGRRAIELSTGKLRLAAVYEYGPRIAFFGKPGGRNLLYWNPGHHARGEWDLRGGHRVWVTRPGADESEEAYRPDNEPAQVAETQDGFVITAALDPITKTKKGFGVRLLADDVLEVDNFIINEGDMLYSGGVWGLTCTAPMPGTRYGIPVGDRSAWDSFSMVFFRSWGGGHTGAYDDPQIRFSNDLLVVEPKGVENKRMLRARPGIIAMCDPARGVTFAKKTEYVEGASYPLGANLAFYIAPGNFMVEMETMGPEKSLRPGEAVRNKETWVLKPWAAALDNATGLLSLF